MLRPFFFPAPNKQATTQYEDQPSTTTTGQQEPKDPPAGEESLSTNPFFPRDFFLEGRRGGGCVCAAEGKERETQRDKVQGGSRETVRVREPLLMENKAKQGRRTGPPPMSSLPGLALGPTLRM